MATREMQLVSRIIRTGDLREVVDWGITENDFMTGEGRTMYQHLIGYYSMPSSAGSVLGQNTIVQYYPSFVPCDDHNMTTKALCLEVRKQRIAIELDNLLDTSRTTNMADPMNALSMVNTGSLDLLNLGLGSNTDMSLGDGISKQLERYLQVESGVDLACGPWPWEIMNEVTGGVQPDDYIIFYGRPKSFKTWILSYFLAFVVENLKRALVYTKEMSQLNVYNRIYACLARINYNRLRLGKLLPEERRRFLAIKRFVELSGLKNNLYCLSGRDAQAGGDTVPWLRSKVEKYKPDYIFIDGMYLMSDARKARRDNQRVANISRDLSDLRLAMQRPVIATLQATREAAKHQEANLDEISFSDAIGQDATGVFRVIKEKEKKSCILILGGAREYHLNGFRINADPAINFTQHDDVEVSAKDIQKAERNDEKPEDNPKAHATNKITPSKAAESVIRTTNKLLQ